MRTLVVKWDKKQKFDQTDILDKLLTEITRINVPLTAVNGTILLTIYENQINFRAINRAALVENFIETLLDKGSPTTIERRTFDFTNQKHLLSHVAAWMADWNCYVVKKRLARDYIQAYLDDIGLGNNADTILAGFIKARIFESRPGDRIAFRYRAFLEYFIANQMQVNPVFRDWILHDQRYLGFVNEIQYYAGINRADNNLLELVSARFEGIREAAVKELGWNPVLGSLEKFQLPSDGTDADNILREYERQVGASPLSPEERDAVLEGDLPADAANRQEVFRPQAIDLGHRLILGLTLYSGLIRNLELVSNQSKRKHLDAALDAWGLFLMASLQIVPQLAKHRKLKVNGVLYEVLVPHHFTEAQTARTIYLAMPTSLAGLVWATLGTEKLELQLTQPSLDDAIEPGIINFIRGSLCADLKIGRWSGMMASFATRYRGSPYLLQVLLWKMRDLHVMGEVSSTESAAFKEVIADVVSTLRGGTHKERLRTKSDHLQKLTRDDYVRRLRTSQSD